MTAPDGTRGKVLRSSSPAVYGIFQGEYRGRSPVKGQVSIYVDNVRCDWLYPVSEAEAVEYVDEFAKESVA